MMVWILFSPLLKGLPCPSPPWGLRHLRAVALRRTVQDLLGHANVETTQIYTHVMKKPGMGVRSPLDSL